MPQNARSERTIRLATAAAVVVAMVFPLLDVFMIFTMWHGGSRPGMWALLATALYLPLQVRLVWYAAHGVKPPAGGLTLAVIAVVFIGALPLVGSAWVKEFSALAVSAMIVLRPRWSAAAVVVLLGAAAPVAIALGDPNDLAVWLACAAADRTATQFVLAWLAAAIRRLQAARNSLAAEAVLRERLRIDGELRRTLGAALDSIAARGQRAAAQAGDGTGATAAELRALVENARTTLAEARRMIRSYQQVSLRAELHTAAALLTAAGITTRLAMPHGALPDEVDAELRARLRAELVRLLRDDAPPTACVITVTHGDSGITLELRTDRGAAEMAA